MQIYQVRIFRNKKWAEIRSYADYQEALDFAQNISVEWDIKEISLAEANKVSA
jgi:D-arabinose 1-dehydrogenase-like Zn-dependent alcohol dehydrogenase